MSLVTQIAACLPAGVVVESATPAQAQDSWATAAERSAIDGAVLRRRREYLAGRAAARRALARLEVTGFDLLPGEDRAPIWPDGLVGSVSHTEELCVVVVARSDTLSSVGVDLEPAEPLEQAMWPEICTEAELAALQQVDAPDRGVRVRAVFCAKEAFYKCQAPLTGHFLEFGEVECHWQKGGFAAQLLATGERWNGRSGCADGHLWAVCWR